MSDSSMLKSIKPVGLLLILFLSAQPASAGEGIQWEASFPIAFEKAKAEKKPIFIAVNMDGERVCEELVKRHYRDPKITGLSKNMFCLFASRYYHKGGGASCPRAENIPCTVHQQVEAEFHRRYPHIGRAEGGGYIAPFHIFLRPDGELLLSVPYMITSGELEWCMAEAVRQVNPSFAWDLTFSARAPQMIQYGKGASSKTSAEKSGYQPLNEEELKALMEEVHDTSPGQRFQVVRRNISSLILTVDKKAMELVDLFLSSDWAVKYGYTAKYIHKIGARAPAEYWEVVEPYVGHDDPRIRNEAIVALEQLAEPKALKALTKQRYTEKDMSVQANLIRAIASVGRADKKTISLLLKIAEKDKEEFMRIHGLIGLAYLEDQEKVSDVLVKALKDESPAVRAAAAYSIATRQEKDLSEALETALENEDHDPCKDYLAAAASALKGGSLKKIQGVLADFAKDEIPRDR